MVENRAAVSTSITAGSVWVSLLAANAEVHSREQTSRDTRARGITCFFIANNLLSIRFISADSSAV
jgi:hypothetical protein